jgi:hypothetical protein
MTRRNNDAKQPRTARQAGPTREDLIEQTTRERNDIRDETSYQARPETEEPDRATHPPAPTAGASKVAAGLDPQQLRDEHDLEASERAFEQSRGSHESRTPPYQEERGGGRGRGTPR